MLIANANAYFVSKGSGRPIILDRNNHELLNKSDFRRRNIKLNNGDRDTSGQTTELSNKRYAFYALLFDLSNSTKNACWALSTLGEITAVIFLDLKQ